MIGDLRASQRIIKGENKKYQVKKKMREIERGRGRNR